MKSRHLAALLALAVSRPAAADPHKLLVLQSEGRADAATRAKIDAAIFKLASAAEPQAVAGELNFSDAATAVGCKPETSICKDEVLGMLSVDEIVITTVTPKPGGLEVTVRRFAKGGGARDATMLLATGSAPDKLDGIAPLFGGNPPAPFGPASPPGPTGPAVATTERPSTEHPSGQPPVIPAPTTVTHEPAPSPVATTPDDHTSGPADQPSTRRHRLEIAGMAGGAGMVTLGLLFWAAASSVQNDINNAPTSTKQDLLDLKDLESKGDGYAGFGNLLVITGLAVGGLGTVFYIKDRYTASSTPVARLAPAVFDHGAGLVFTMGGTP
jgi:hypothetical protein